ncbi:MAG: YbjP/YqhG family protein [Acidobacteriota bacterium]|nr:YbjP/YqhG family protein [Acidobacteriota bacterium]
MFYCLLLTACCSLSCSVPNLESPECTAARQTVREFYSQHFGGDMKFTPENLRAREKYLTPDLARLLQKFLTGSDPFTLTPGDDLPKAFRVGGCKTVAPDKTELQVLLFWKDDARSEQREIRVEAVRQSEEWLIGNISNNTSNLQNILNH